MFGLVVLASSSPLHGKVPRLIVKTTSRQSSFLKGVFSAARCSSVSPRFSHSFFYRDANSVLLSTPLYSKRGHMLRTLCSKLLIITVFAKSRLQLKPKK